ncbi:MAG: hypothetical protein OSA98_10975, partial [Rubripirellula sp.]|nr:hypothetical protein [Rubripirellula sp.]
MLKPSHRQKRKQARRPKLETLEKRQLFAGDIVGVTAVAADATIKADLQAVYATPVAKTSVVEQTGNKDGDVAMAADPRLSQAADQIDSILATVGAEGSSFDFSGVLSKLGAKSDDGHIAPTPVSTVDSALDSLFGNTTETNSEGQTDPLGIFISTLVGQSGADLGSTGLPDIGGTATTSGGIEELVGNSSNSLVSEMGNGALSTVPDDSSPLPEHKHEDGNTATSGSGEWGLVDKVLEKIFGSAEKVERDLLEVSTAEKIQKRLEEPSTQTGESPQEESENPDPTGDPAAFLSIADLVAFEQ